MQKTTPELMDQWKDVFVKKNKDYGNSWEKTGKILEVIFDGKAPDLTDPVKLNVLALLVRILDKICRFCNIFFFKNSKGEINESLVETAGDAGVYFFMLAELTGRQIAPKSPQVLYEKYTRSNDT